MFPFEVPEDLTALSAEEFAAFLTQVREFAQTVVADEAASAELLTATAALFERTEAENTTRTETAAAGVAARAALASGLAQPEATPEPVEPAAVTPPVEPAATPEPQAVTASRAPGSTLDAPPADAAPTYVRMVASSDAPGNGGELATFGDAVKLIGRRLSTYSSSTKARHGRSNRIGDSNRFAIGGRPMARHGNVAFQREFEPALTIGTQDAKNALSILDYAANPKRLPGGSLVASMERQVAAGKSLTAAVGWCAPSETIYDLCEVESMDGILDIPEVQAMRGGFFVPENGGPDFSSIFESIGDEGDVILTEYEVENGAEKVCVEIPCPDFIEVRMDVAYVCITGSLLQDRGYPEATARFSRGAMVALAHKVNASVIARMVAQSGGPITIPTIPGSDDAASQLLAAVELAVEDIKYRNRMSRSAVMEVVLPAWILAPIRAAMSRRRGVRAEDVSDAEILGWFTTRRAVPRFVYDWQDAFSGLAGGPGGSSPITVFPDEVQFLVYPAGTWVKPVRDVINLDTVYDNALLTSNQYTALFAEDGFNVIKMCVESRLYQVDVDVAGLVGCCDADAFS